LAPSRKHDSLLVTSLPNVRYLTGFTGSAGCALLTPRHRLFFTDFRYRTQAAHEVSKHDVHIVTGSSLVGCCQYITKRRLKTGVIGFEGGKMSLREHQIMRKLLKGFNFSDASGEIEKQRLVKNRFEINKLRQAAAVTDAAFRGLLRRRIIGRSEKEVAWILEAAMRRAGSGSMPFEIIVASGPRSAMPHGAASDRVIRAGELVVIDMGASIDGYCSDSTRTFATGPLTRKLTEIYGVVEEAQRRALNGVLAGASGNSVDAIARDYISAAGYGKAFGHSLGHGVGLEAHEGPVLSTASRDVLQPGMTLTIEPGIYLEGKGGVRIEDTVLVAAKGPEILTNFPRALRIIH